MEIYFFKNTFQFSSKAFQFLGKCVLMNLPTICHRKSCCDETFTTHRHNEKLFTKTLMVPPGVKAPRQALSFSNSTVIPRN